MSAFATLGIVQVVVRDSASLFSAQTVRLGKARMPGTVVGLVSLVTRALAPTQAYQEVSTLAMLGARIMIVTTVTATCCSPTTAWQPTPSQLLGLLGLAGGPAFQQLKPIQGTGANDVWEPFGSIPGPLNVFYSIHLPRPTGRRPEQSAISICPCAIVDLLLGLDLLFLCLLHALSC